MNARTPLAAALALLLAVVLASSASAGPRRGWELIGERTVNDAVDHDTILVTRAEGTFRAIRIKVFERAVQFRKVTIHFANGADQEVELRHVIPAGGESRIIDVNGGDRVIRSIDFVYDAQSVGGHKALVRVFGRN